MKRGAARFVAGADAPARIPPAATAEVAFAGRSNVGKSSLLNRLVGQRGLARVSKTPGRTQQINFFEIGSELTLVDLPGYGFAKVPLKVKEAWRGLVESYLSDRDALCGVIVLVDGRRGVQDDDIDLIDYLAVLEVPCLVAVTKIDKLKRSQRVAQLRQLENDLPTYRQIPCSAQTGEGIPEIWKAVEELTS